jgi:DNA-binding NtrC family response regulator
MPAICSTVPRIPPCHLRAGEPRLETDMTSLLIIDDEEKMSSVLARMLGREGYDVEHTTNPASGLESLARKHFDIILCDLRMPELSGIDVLERARRLSPSTDFVVMTAYATAQTAVESMKKGALDYLIKPFPMDELKLLLKRIEETRNLREENQRLREVIGQKFSVENIVAESRQMQDVLARARKVAASNASVLLRGESGTGKEVLAKAIHTMSSRAAGTLVMVNCGAVPENLLESEFFGHVKGSFTGAIDNRKGMFETANGGSIFLDEIGEVPLHLQVKLLRVLQEGEIQRIGESTAQKVDVRIIAATNRNLEEAVAAGTFRQDLYYRLNVIPVQIPPLRERPDDIPPLIEFFLRKFSQADARKRLSPDSLSLLLRYDYPGNIRELENAIEHAVVLSEQDVIQIGDLPLQVQNFEWTRSAGVSNTGAEAMRLEDIEKRCILSALEKARYNYTRAAAHLGITRRTLGYRIQKYGLEEIVAGNMQKAKENRG